MSMNVSTEPVTPVTMETLETLYQQYQALLDKHTQAMLHRQKLAASMPMLLRAGINILLQDQDAARTIFKSVGVEWNALEVAVAQQNVAQRQKEIALDEWQRAMNQAPKDILQKWCSRGGN